MLNQLKTEQSRVFHYFEQICKIPHGSGNMAQISSFCEGFAKEHNLKCIRDEHNNIIIFKLATKGKEGAEPIILQGHLDMVCQKEEGCTIDFLNDAIAPYIDGDYIKAKGTTLGADNGIAVAMILAILEGDEYSHPPIEAVFTVDEEIGLLGAGKLDCSLLKSKRMINIDSEEEDIVTVSCAGGRDFRARVMFENEDVTGEKLIVTLKGLQGGHSGVEIHKGRVSANILAGRFLNYFAEEGGVHLVCVNGGDKVNAITNLCKIEVVVENKDAFITEAKAYLEAVKYEIFAREKDFCYTIAEQGAGNYSVIKNSFKKTLSSMLMCTPQGVIDMSAEIEGLVETSMNLGILKTEESYFEIHYSFRSNKKSAIDNLESRMRALCSFVPNCEIYIYGSYPSWEYKADSPLRELYCECYKAQYLKAPKIEAIHAGLECGVFSNAIMGLDCISIGPDMTDVHTFNEKLSIRSTENIFKVLVSLLAKCE